MGERKNTNLQPKFMDLRTCIILVVQDDPIMSTDTLVGIHGINR